MEATASLPTPILVVHQKILEKNIHRIHAYADQHGLMVRPHVKTHKSLTIGHLQMDAGAIGIAVAKLRGRQVKGTAYLILPIRSR